MDRQYSLPLILMLPALLLQITVVQFISIESIAPSFVVIALVFCTLNYGQIYGTVLGFISGGIFDFFSGGAIGVAMFSLSLAGFLAGYFYDENKIVEKTFGISFSLVVFVSALTASIVTSFLESSMAETGLTLLFFEHSIPSAIYTTVFSVAVLFFRREIKVG